MNNPLAKKPCTECGRTRGHKTDCIFHGTKDIEPAIIFPDGMQCDGDVEKYLVILPIPNTTDEFFYCSPGDYVRLLRANKRNPEAIQYLADMLE